MSQVITLARKELRTFFQSPVALIFLGAFLFAVLFAFFWVDTFFRRNIADIRPLFQWLPIFLIFLVGALTMRLWSEEQKSGTLEILLTLPIKTHRLVLGKFLAGMALVSVALLLTLGVPITVSFLGDLDWGPIFGGYIGALLLAGAYLAIGLCLSSSTDNPIVALISTWLACGALYLVGSDVMTSFADNRVGELMAALGAGSRFESIGRGVLDIRDLLYYGSIIVGFLLLNTALLEAKGWSMGPRTRPRRLATKLTVGLVFANLLVLNVTMAAVKSVRIDMTERQEHSLSKVTKKLLGELDAPLIIRGYFSDKTHPLLAPLVPAIRDRIEEYGAVGGKMVETDFLDPSASPALEKEVNESYGIKSVPFQFQDRHQAAVVNSYFSILIKFGDKYETLGFEQIIEITATGMDKPDVKLRNLEYDLTKTIKKVVHGFSPLESVFARSPHKITLTAYLTPRTLPVNFKDLPGRLEKVTQEIKERSGGKFEVTTVDPSDPGKEKLQQELFDKYGFKPMAVSLFSQELFYFHILLQAGDRHEVVYPAPEMSEADLRTEVTAALKRLTPGFLKKVGIHAPAPPQPPQNPMMGRQPPPPQKHRFLQAKLAENYTVQDLDLKDGRVPGDIDVLLIIGPKNMDDKQQFAVDQYLMRGGTVVLCSGAFSMNTQGRGGLSVVKGQSGLEQMLEGWGVKVLPQLVMDAQNESFPVPVEHDVGGLRVQQIEMLPYPYFVDIRQDGMAEDNPILASLPSVTMNWASPLELKEVKELTAQVLLRSSERSWTTTDEDVQPNMDQYPKTGFAEGKDFKSQVLAVALTGTFQSAFADKASPLFGPGEGQKGGEKKGDPAGRTIKKSPKAARLIVTGSEEFINDMVLNLSRQTGSDKFTSNLQYVQNLVDWAVADLDLLTIRSRGTFARTLKPMEESARSTWEGINYGLVIFGLAVIFGINFIRRRSVIPMKLVQSKIKKEESR